MFGNFSSLHPSSAFPFLQRKQRTLLSERWISEYHQVIGLVRDSTLCILIEELSRLLSFS